MPELDPTADRWRAAAGGDEGARAELAALTHALASAELAARHVPLELREDLAQETVRAVLAYMTAGGAPPRHLRPFLKWRALGVLSDHRKRCRVEQRMSRAAGSQDPTDAASGPVVHPVGAALREELRAALADCRSRLGYDARTVLELRYDRGLETAEIARTLGVSRNVVNVRTFRAMRSLRECLTGKRIEAEDVAWES